MRRSAAAGLVVGGLVAALVPAAASAPPSLAAEAARYRTAAEFPDELLDRLPSSALEAGLLYAPRLVQVTAPTPAERTLVANSGLDVTEHAGDDYLEVVLHSASQEVALRSLGMPFEVVTADMIALEHERIMADAAFFRANASTDLPSRRTSYRVLEDFGSEIDTLVADNPDLAKRISVGKSVEGRDLTAIEIGVGVTDPEDGRPVFLMFGNHHAREWPSAEAPMEFAHDLVNTFNAGDARTVDLLSRARVIIVPVSNPDGYDASRTTGDLVDLRPIDGGGTVSILATPGNAYKRKNCRIVDGQTQPPGPCLLLSSPGGNGIGIDLNRNYGGLWGGPGASGDQTSALYRGPEPFSEPETQAIRTLISTRQVTTVITNHTFGNLLLRPVGIQPDTIGPDGLPVGFSPDECFALADGTDNGMQALGERMTAQTGYSNQFGWELYDTTGTTEDYSYNATGGYGYTFEIGPDEFHPPFEDYLAEYLGTSASAQAVNEDRAPGLTSPSGRDCGEKIAAETFGGGLQEAYFLALENAADAATHSRLVGTAPEGAEIGVTRTGDFPLWDGGGVADTVTTAMTVGDDGTFTYHVNPSTRPFADSRPYEDPDFEAPVVDVTVVDEEELTGNTQPPMGEPENIPIVVPAGIDSLVIEVTAELPTDDYDIALLSPDLVELDQSATEFTDERVAHEISTGIQPGEYVLQIQNFAAEGDWTATVTTGTLPDDVVTDADLLFSPRTEEAWTVTCTIDGEVRSNRDVIVDRGERADLGDVCRVGSDGGTDEGSGSGGLPSNPIVSDDPTGGRDVTTRLSGADRYATAIDVSRQAFPAADSAAAVVLTRGDDPNGFADALAGGPFAIERDAPLLITEPGRLLASVAAEIDRVLPAGGTVHLLGGKSALDPAVEAALVDAGYRTDRIAGPTRYDTAIAIADRLGNPDLTLVATGESFADALAASAAAGANGGAVLLTTSGTPNAATTAYLDEHAPARVLTIGGPAARAYPDATSVVGADRFATATDLAELLFSDPEVAGLARGDAFPDALAGAAHVGRLGGPMLLTPTDSFAPGVQDLLCSERASIDELFVYGGTQALSASVYDSGAASILDGATC